MSKIKTNQIETVDGTLTHDVATMGIESGSNENGSWVKFPDGTMICYNLITGNWVTDSAHGALFFNSIDDILFPQTFIDVPSTSADTSNHTSGLLWANAARAATTGFSLMIIATENTAEATRVSYTAIGRWK